MPHLRNRALFTSLNKALSWSPAVGVFGLRQVGKSTLVKSIVQEKSGAYKTFDSTAVLNQSELAPVAFCDVQGLLCLDESQKAPWIFPVIKQLIDEKRKPGRFLLTGSIRFTLKKEIREALTGRILLFELLPFTLSEAHQLPPANFLSSIMVCIHAKNPASALKSFFEKIGSRRFCFQPATIGKHFLLGGMPNVCFSRDEEQRQNWCATYFETFLERDLPLVDSSLAKVSYRQGMALLRQLALQQGKSLDLSELSRHALVSLNLVKKIVTVLEALSLIDLVPTDASAKNTSRKREVQWKDSGLWNYFMQIKPDHALIDSALLGLGISQELRAQCQHLSTHTEWLVYRTRNGGHIPWIFRAGKSTIALTLSLSEVPTAYETRMLTRFVNQNKGAVGVVLAPPRTSVQQIGERLWVIPFMSVFEKY